MGFIPTDLFSLKLSFLRILCSVFWAHAHPSPSPPKSALPFPYLFHFVFFLFFFNKTTTATNIKSDLCIHVLLDVWPSVEAWLITRDQRRTLALTVPHLSVPSSSSARFGSVLTHLLHEEWEGLKDAAVHGCSDKSLGINLLIHHFSGFSPRPKTHDISCFCFPRDKRGYSFWSSCL